MSGHARSSRHLNSNFARTLMEKPVPGQGVAPGARPLPPSRQPFSGKNTCLCLADEATCLAVRPAAAAACRCPRLPPTGGDAGAAGAGLGPKPPLDGPPRVTIQPLDTASHFLIKGAKQHVAGLARQDGWPHPFLAKLSSYWPRAGHL